jgi:hypothetical protein
MSDRKLLILLSKYAEQLSDAVAAPVTPKPSPTTTIMPTAEPTTTEAPTTTAPETTQAATTTSIPTTTFTTAAPTTTNRPTTGTAKFAVVYTFGIQQDGSRKPIYDRPCTNIFILSNYDKSHDVFERMKGTPCQFLIKPGSRTQTTVYGNVANSVATMRSKDGYQPVTSSLINNYSGLFPLVQSKIREQYPGVTIAHL